MHFRLLVSWTWFFLVLFSSYVLKPVRDALATETRLFGPLYLATFLAVCAALPLYWRIVARTTRRQLVFGVYQFFVACLIAFAVALDWVGFLLSAIPLTLALMRLIDPVRWPLAVPVAIAVPAGMWWLLKHGLGIQLPSGIFGIG